MISHKRKVKTLARDNSVVIKIDGDDSGFKSALSGIGNVAKKGLGVAVKGIVAVGTAFTGATVAALKFSGELEQNLGGSEAVFKNYAKQMQGSAQTAFKNMGLSASDFLGTAKKMGSLFQGAGFGIKESADLSAQAMQRAADVASIMGIDVSWAMESIAGAAKGNFTMMDNLGVAMNATTIEAYALSKGIQTSYNEMSNQQKIGLAMEMFLEKTAYAAGNYARENETLAGALNTAGTALKNFIAGTGTVEDVADSLTNAAKVILKNTNELLPSLVEGIEELVSQLIPLLPDILRQLIPAVLSVVDELIDALVSATPGIVSAIADGIGSAIPALKPLSDLIKTLVKNFDTLAVSATAGFAAFKGYAILNTVITSFKTAKVVLDSLTLATNTNIAAETRGITISALRLKYDSTYIASLNLKTIAVGVLTGKIHLQTAATVALKKAQDLLSGGMTIIITILAAVVAAIGTYIIKCNAASKEISKAIDEIKQTHYDAIKSIDATVSAELTEAETAKILTKELYDLEKQLSDGSVTQEEATEIQNKFNVVAGKLNEIIPGIIDNLYDENGAISIQRSKIDELTNSYYKLAMAKAMATAYEEKMTETAKALIDAKEVQKKAKKNEQAALSTYKTATNPLSRWHANSLHEKAEESLKKANENVSYYTEELANYKDGWVEASEALNKLMDEMPESKKTVEETDNDFTSTVETGNVARTAATKEALKEQGEDTEEAYKKELRDLQFLHDMEEISDAEYYARLTQYRDKYFDEGTDEWQKYTLEIYKGTKSLTEKQKKEYDDLINKVKNTTENAVKTARNSIDEVMRLQEGISQKLSEGNTAYNTISIQGMGSFTKLADISKDNEQLDRYNMLIDKLYQRRGTELPSEVIDNLQSMGIDEGITYIQTMLKASDEDFDKYISNLTKKEALAEEAAKKLTLRETENLRKELEKKFGQVPEDFFAIGEDSAKKYGEGFMQQLRDVLSQVKAEISASLSALMPTVNGPVYAGGGGTTNYYTNSFSVGTSKNTVQEQISAWDNATALARLRGQE